MLFSRERERLRGEIDNLKRQLEEAQRANKRQAAPFSRGTRKEHPKTPGRKPGAAYGRRYCKLPPKQVDEIVPVPRSEEHTSELQSHSDLVCRLLLEKKKKRSGNQDQV